MLEGIESLHPVLQNTGLFQRMSKSSDYDPERHYHAIIHAKHDEAKEWPVFVPHVTTHSLPAST
jgi:hypothetical protein